MDRVNHVFFWKFPYNGKSPTPIFFLLWRLLFFCLNIAYIICSWLNVVWVRDRQGIWLESARRDLSDEHKLFNSGIYFMPYFGTLRFFQKSLKFKFFWTRKCLKFKIQFFFLFLTWSNLKGQRPRCLLDYEMVCPGLLLSFNKRTRRFWAFLYTFLTSGRFFTHYFFKCNTFWCFVIFQKM